MGRKRRNQSFGNNFSRRMRRSSSRHPNDYGVRLGGGTWSAHTPGSYLGFLLIDGAICVLSFAGRAIGAAVGAAVESNRHRRRNY